MNTDEHRWAARVPALLLVAMIGSIHAHTGQDAKKAKVDYAKAKETAFGMASDPGKAKRVVSVEMGDTMRFTPAVITVNRGDTVRFVVKNTGKLMHEMVLGTRKELAEHAEMMKKHPEMEHDEPYMLHVAPGAAGEMGWQFTKAGEFHYGCFVPGHFEAGMVGTIKVAETKDAAASKAFVDGDVRKVDKDAGKVTLRHGPIPNLDMPAMTMVFRAKDPAMLDAVKVGDKVRFKADKIQGTITVTEIQPAK